MNRQKKAWYEQKVAELTPKPTVGKNLVWAFLTGGAICLAGEIMQSNAVSMGLDKKDAAMLVSMVLIFLTVLLTGLGIFDEIGRRAGAGTIVPITGFANSMASCAIEFKREGYVFGVGAKLFVIAGPVLVYGLTSAWLVGLARWIRNMGW
jgi:stage V sporulation protein AC